MRRGRYAQRLARRHLEGLGYSVLEENYRCRWGELDIIAVEGDCLVFIEVRSRTGGEFGSPEESITPAKAQRLALLADVYRDDRTGLDLPDSSRIDVVAVDLDRRGRLLDLRLHRSAVEAPPMS